MDVAFCSLNFVSYFVTVSYDQALHVYSLANEGSYECLFSYHNKDSDVGFFTHVVFFPLKQKYLKFLVGTSGGYVLKFSSESSFTPEKYRVDETQIEALDVS